MYFATQLRIHDHPNKKTCMKIAVKRSIAEKRVIWPHDNRYLQQGWFT